MEQEQLLDFGAITARVFSAKGGVVFIGGQEVSQEMRELLRDQARGIATSQLWEILDASIVNEAANLALIQSAEWDHVLSAKMLKHYSHFINNVLHTLAK